jgi:hypothetical protein
MKKYYTNNVKVGDYVTWHNSGWWGSQKVVYIGRGFVIIENGAKLFFEDIILGHYTVWETLPICDFGINKDRIHNTYSEDILKSDPRYNEYLSLRIKLGISKTRKNRVETVKRKYIDRKSANIFKNVYIKGGQDL